MLVIVLFCTLSTITVLFWMSPRAAVAGTNHREQEVAGDGAAADPASAAFWRGVDAGPGRRNDAGYTNGQSYSGGSGLPGVGIGAAVDFSAGGADVAAAAAAAQQREAVFLRPNMSSARGAACYTACCNGLALDSGVRWSEDDRNTRAIRPFDELDHGGAQPRHRILTPQWLPGVDAAIIFSLDDFADVKDPNSLAVFTDVKVLAGGAVTRDLRGGMPGSGLVIFTRGLPNGVWTNPQAGMWASDGVEFGAHTTAHACPIYASGCASVLSERRRASMWQTLLAAEQYMAARPLCFR